MPDNEKSTGTAAAAGGAKKWMLAGGAALVLVAGGIVAGSLIGSAPEPASTDTGAAADAAPARSDKPALYTGLHPPLVVNFTDSRGESHFMQINLEVMARDRKVLDAVQNHAPAIRNSLILLYGNTEYEAAVTREGKERMLAAALAEIQAILRERTGDDGVEAVYFTNLIIQ